MQINYLHFNGNFFTLLENDKDIPGILNMNELLNII